MGSFILKEYISLSWAAGQACWNFPGLFYISLLRQRAEWLGMMETSWEFRIQNTSTHSRLLKSPNQAK